MSKTDLSPEL
jgi:hypothetical protein